MRLSFHAARLSVFLFIWGIIALGIALYSGAQTLEGDDPVTDPSFEKRLVIQSTYHAREGDTLRTAAHLLYGHKSWWSRLRKENRKHLKGVGPDQPLLLGLALKYRRPEIGSTYTVQTNDWLIRIVQWKYGDTSLWEDIYKRNSQKITDPNLIHPGDRLILELDGTVRQADSGQVLVQGVQSLANTGAAVVSQLPHKIETLPEPQNWSGSALLGFISGLLLLLLIPIWWWMRSRNLNRVPAAAIRLPVTVKKKSKPKPRIKRAPVRKSNYPATFDRRPISELGVDSSLVHRDQGDIDERPNYHTISDEAKKRQRKSA